jgi:hypothetical protein
MRASSDFSAINRSRSSPLRLHESIVTRNHGVRNAGVVRSCFGCVFYRTEWLICWPVSGSTLERVRCTPLGPWVNGPRAFQFPQARHAAPIGACNAGETVVLDCTSESGVPGPLNVILAALRRTGWTETLTQVPHQTEFSLKPTNR